MPPRRSTPAFQPRFTIGLLYLGAFFALYCFLMAAPELLGILRGAPGPEQQQMAERAMRDALEGRLFLALAAALVTTGLLGWWGALPGTGRR